MSGSDNSGGGHGYDSGGEDCESLTIDTQLSSPKEDIVRNVKVGDVLEIELVTTGGTAVVTVLSDGKVAGGLASPNIQRLRECISSGTEYSATVTQKQLGQVRVRVRATK